MRGLRPRSVDLGRAQLLAALAVAAVFVLAAAVVVTRNGTRLAGTNGVPNLQWAVDLKPGQTACQTTVLLSKGSAGARVFVGTFGRLGPRLLVTVAKPSGEILRRGTLSPGYADARWQVVPFSPIETSSRGDTLCISSAGGRIALAGVRDPNVDNRSLLLVSGKQQPADLSLQLVRSGRQSLLGLVPTIFHRAALFRPGWVGPWTYYLLFVLLLLTVGAAVAALIALGQGKISLRGGLVTAVLIAFLNAAIWSLVMPAFNPPDEASHYAYVASLVDLGRRPYTNPALPGGSFSAKEELAVEYTALGIVQQRQAKPPWTEAAYQEWASASKTIEQTRPYQIGGGYNTTASYSPFYYGLESGPYAAGRGLDIFSQLWLMRLLSAVLAAATAGCAVLFAREMLPAVPWAGLVAGLAVGFEPMFAQIGGAVNNDNLLILCASLELYLLARILHQGSHAVDWASRGSDPWRRDSGEAHDVRARARRARRSILRSSSRSASARRLCESGRGWHCIDRRSDRQLRRLLGERRLDAGPDRRRRRSRLSATRVSLVSLAVVSASSLIHA